MSTPPDQIRAARIAAGLTQDTLASRAGVTAKTVYRMERGERVRPANEQRIHAALGLPYVEEPDPTDLGGPRLIGNPDLLADPDTRKMRLAHPSEQGFLVRADPEAWREAMRQLSWWQAMTITGGRAQVILPIVFTLMGPFLLLWITGIAVQILKVQHDALPNAVVVVWFWLVATLIWLFGVLGPSVTWPYRVISHRPCGVTLDDKSLWILTVRDAKVDVQRIGLSGATITRLRHAEFVTYTISAPDGPLRDLPGLPFDEAFDAALIRFDTGSAFQTVTVPEIAAAGR